MTTNSVIPTGVIINTNNNFLTARIYSTKTATGLKNASFIVGGGVGIGDNVISLNEVNGGNIWSRNSTMTYNNTYIGGDLYVPKWLISTSNGLVLKQHIIPDPTYSYSIDFSPLFNFTTTDTSTATQLALTQQNKLDESLPFTSHNICGTVFNKQNKYLLPASSYIDLGNSTTRWGHIFSTNVDSLNTTSVLNDFQELVVHNIIHLGTNVNGNAIVEINPKFADTIAINGSIQVSNLEKNILFNVLHDTEQIIINGDVDINDFIKINKDDVETNIKGYTKIENLSVEKIITVKPQICILKNEKETVYITSSIVFLYADVSCIASLQIDMRYYNAVIKIILKKNPNDSKIVLYYGKDTYTKLNKINEYIEVIFYDGVFEYLGGKIH